MQHAVASKPFEVWYLELADTRREKGYWYNDFALYKTWPKNNKFSYIGMYKKIHGSQKSGIFFKFHFNFLAFFFNQSFIADPNYLVSTEMSRSAIDIDQHK